MLKLWFFCEKYVYIFLLPLISFGTIAIIHLLAFCTFHCFSLQLYCTCQLPPSFDLSQSWSGYTSSIKTFNIVIFQIFHESKRQTFFLVPSMQPWKKLNRINGISRPANVIHTGMWNLYSMPRSKEVWIVASGTPKKLNRGISNFGGSHTWRTIVHNWGFWEDDGL